MVILMLKAIRMEIWNLSKIQQYREALHIEHQSIASDYDTYDEKLNAKCF